MLEWLISLEERAGYLDLRTEDLTFADAEGLLEMIEPHVATQGLDRIVLDVRGLEPLPAAMQVLLAGLKARAEAFDFHVDLRVDILSE